MKYLLILYSLLLLSNQSTSAQIVDTVTILPVESYKLNNDYVKRLSNQADFYYGSGNYKKAISIGEEKVSILRRLYGEENVEYALSLSELAFYLYNNGEYKKAVDLATKSVKILDDKGMSESIIYATIINRLSIFLEYINDKNSALQYRQSALQIFKKSIIGDDYLSFYENKILPNIFSKYSKDKESVIFQNAINEYWVLRHDSIDYAINLFIEETFPSSEKGDYIKAIDSIRKVLKILYKWEGDFGERYISSLLLLSTYYAEAKRYNECYKICERHVELTKKYCGELSSEYAKAISNYAFGLFKGGEYMKAIEKEQKAMDICISVNDNLQYACSLSNMGVYHNRIGSLNKAIEYNKEALPILESYNQNSACANTMVELSDLYCKTGEFESAILLAEKALSLVDYQSRDYYGYQTNLANCYFYLKDYEKAIYLLEEICKNLEQSNDNDIMLASIFESLAISNYKAGRMGEAIWSQERSIEIQNKWTSKENLDLAKSLSFLGHLYVTIGDKTKGIQLEEKAADIIKDIEGENTIDFVDVLRSLSYAYYNDNEKKLKLLEKAITIMENNKIGGLEDYININGKLAYCYASAGKEESVKETENNIRKNQTIQSYFEKNEDVCKDFWNTISQCYSLLGDYKKANEIESSILELSKRKYGNDISKYNDVLLNMIMNYAYLSDTTNIIRILKETNLFDFLKKEIASNIITLSYKRRSDFWTYIQKIFTDAIPFLAAITMDEYLISRAYDISALFAKKILLKTEMNMPELIDRYDDEQLKEDYKCYINNKSRLCLVYDKNEEDSLIKIINYQENIIRKRMFDIGLLEQTDCSWKDIKSKMNRNDIAIEFLCFDNGEYGQFVSALLLKKEYTSPKLINICPVDIMRDYYNKKQNDSLNIVIWGKLEGELKDVKNIYFSPAGPIYNLPIEYLYNSEGIYMNDKYNIFRVSSTKNLLNSYDENKIRLSALYGGLDYDFDLDGTMEDTNNHLISVDRGLRDLVSKRNGFDKLVNTEIEITEISKILTKSNIKCLTYKGKDGIEESFKNLSGQSFDLIHLSTHGMYIGTDKAEEQKQANNLIFIKEEENSIQYEDAALSRSFLVMSGGNMLPKHKFVPDGNEDGILTAQEIASLDFRGLDLVVLSACQTGMGDIDNDGVYGLQRGFKKAGANTILMSLDKVDDEATKILMVEFYRNLMSGKSKHQSLKDAQKYLRQVDNGKYDKPEYWASFIMLDGLN